jgi:hypothetical protein
MGRRGAQPTPTSELLFWEGLWYSVFHHLRGTLPSYEKVAVDQEVKKQLRAELSELVKSVAKNTVEEDWIARHQVEIDRELRPKVPVSESQIWRALVAARRVADVRKACRDSQRWLNPEWGGRPYVQDLTDHAEKFLRAKQDVYYPRRDSSDEKRVIFFARAMAGITLGISPSTSVDRLRKLKHGTRCPCVQCDLKRWDRIERQVYKFSFGTGNKSSRKGR